MHHQFFKQSYAPVYLFPLKALWQGYTILVLLIFAQSIYCGYLLEVALKSSDDLCFEQKINRIPQNFFLMKIIIS